MIDVKVAVISTCCLPSPPVYGGIERVVWFLADELGKMGCEAVLFAPKGSVKPPNAEVFETVEPRFDFDMKREAQAMLMYKDTLPGFDIIHDHSHYLFSYKVKKDNPNIKLNVIATVHTLVPWRAPPPVKYPNLCGISRSHARWLTSRLGVPVRYVYNGINIDEFEYREKKEDYVLFLGRIMKEKGVHIAVDIAKKTREHLIIAGEDFNVPDQRYVRMIMDRCDDANITYLGKVSNEKRIELLAGAKAVLMPSLFDEPFGLVAVEALASGTPVIASNMGALPEIVTSKCGFTVDPVDVEMWVKALRNVGRIKPENCRRRAENFTSRRMAEKYLKLYGKVLRGEEW